MSAALPSGWFDHSMPDLISGYLYFTALDDPFEGYPTAEINCYYRMFDSLEDEFMYDGMSMSFTFDDREWIGVEERDGLGYVEVLADIGENAYVSVFFEGLDSRSDEVQLILTSFRVNWN